MKNGLFDPDSMYASSDIALSIKGLNMIDSGARCSFHFWLEKPCLKTDDGEMCLKTNSDTSTRDTQYESNLPSPTKPNKKAKNNPPQSILNQTTTTITTNTKKKKTTALTISQSRADPSQTILIYRLPFSRPPPHHRIARHTPRQNGPEKRSKTRKKNEKRRAAIKQKTHTRTSLD
jgi:hypothetical protein